MQQMKSISYLITHKQINSIWIKDLYVGLKLKDLKGIGLGNDFLYMTQKTQAHKKGKTDNWTSSKFKTFVHQRALLTKWKGNAQSRRKY